MNKPPFIKSNLFLALGMMVMLSLLLAACGDSTTATTASTSGNTSTNTQAPATTSSGGPTNNTTYGSPAANTAAPATTAAGAATTAAATSASGSGASAPLPAATTAASSTTAPASKNEDVRATPPPSQVNQEPLKAGAVDDNLKFDEYLRYLQSYRDRPGLPFDISERYIISVMDGNARTVSNSTVRVYSGDSVIFEGKTFSNGQVMFFPRATPAAQQATTFEVTAEKDGRSANATFKRTENGQNQNANGGTIWTLQMTGSMRPAIDPAPNLDLLFLLDSTGSMGGEIRQIQQTISDISRQISELPGSPKVRYGVVTYRDRGDSYVTRKYGFTTSLGDFSNFLNSISAGGGGDKPESVQEALHVAIDEMNWATGDSVRLTFLVADAAPHLDYQQDYKYTDTIQTAVKKGIKVYTIGASGLEKQGEYVFRQLSQITLAQFLFVTRGGDEQSAGSGGPASNTNVVYEEKNLDRIVVNIVRRELTNLTQ